MPYSVTFDPQRKRYRVRRWWPGGYELKNVPKKKFTDQGVPFDQSTRRGDQIAERWAAANEERKQAEAVSGVSSDRMTLEQVFALYRDQNPREVTPATLKKNGVDFANLGRLITLLPEQIDDAAATMYRNARKKEGAAARTIVNELSFLKQLLTFAHRWKRVTGMRELNLFELPFIEQGEADQVALTEEEFRRLIVTPFDFNTARNRRWAIFGVTTMLRASNLFGLRKEWIDRGDRWLTIPPEELKGGKRKNRLPLSVPLCDVAIDVLPEWRAGQTGYVWPNPATGEPFTWVHENFRRWAEKAKVPIFSPHDLRTTGNTWLTHHGVDEFFRAVLLGQAKTSVTQIYTRAFRDHIRGVVGIFDEILGTFSEHVARETAAK
jgi:integrase